MHLVQRTDPNSSSDSYTSYFSPMSALENDLTACFHIINTDVLIKPVRQLLSCVQLSATPWIIACQALPSMGFPRQEYWSG